MKLGNLTLGDLTTLVNDGIKLTEFISTNYTDDINRDVAKFILESFVKNENNIQRHFEYTEEEILNIKHVSNFSVNYDLLIDKIVSGMEFETEELIESDIQDENDIEIDNDYFIEEYSQEFEEYLKSDNVIATGIGYKNQETLYNKLFTKQELYDFFVNEYIRDELSGAELDDLAFENATKKLTSTFREVRSGGADWAVRTWEVKYLSEELGWYICDDEYGNLEFTKRVGDDEGFEYDIIHSVEYKDIDELLEFVAKYNFNASTDDEVTQQVIADL